MRLWGCRGAPLTLATPPLLFPPKMQPRSYPLPFALTSLPRSPPLPLAARLMVQTTSVANYYRELLGAFDLAQLHAAATTIQRMVRAARARARARLVRGLRRKYAGQRIERWILHMWQVRSPLQLPWILAFGCGRCFDVSGERAFHTRTHLTRLRTYPHIRHTHARNYMALHIPTHTTTWPSHHGPLPSITHSRPRPSMTHPPHWQWNKWTRAAGGGPLAPPSSYSERHVAAARVIQAFMRRCLARMDLFWRHAMDRHRIDRREESLWSKRQVHASTRPCCSGNLAWLVC